MPGVSNKSEIYYKTNYEDTSFGFPVIFERAPFITIWGDECLAVPYVNYKNLVLANLIIKPGYLLKAHVRAIYNIACENNVNKHLFEKIFSHDAKVLKFILTPEKTWWETFIMPSSQEVKLRELLFHCMDGPFQDIFSAGFPFITQPNLVSTYIRLQPQDIIYIRDFVQTLGTISSFMPPNQTRRFLDCHLTDEAT